MKHFFDQNMYPIPLLKLTPAMRQGGYSDTSSFSLEIRGFILFLVVCVFCLHCRLESNAYYDSTDLVMQ